MESGIIRDALGLVALLRLSGVLPAVAAPLEAAGFAVAVSPERALCLLPFLRNG